jgi:hypothetical protein
MQLRRLQTPKDAMLTSYANADIRILIILLLYASRVTITSLGKHGT